MPISVKCDNCGANIGYDVKCRAIGDVEVMYLQCQDCLSEYVVSITDSKLRKMINERSNYEEIKEYHKYLKSLYK